MVADVAPPEAVGGPARRARRIYRRRLLLVLALLLAGFGAGGWLSARRTAHQAWLAGLRAPLEQAVASGEMPRDLWATLAPADRPIVALSLLRLPEVRWQGTLDDVWLIRLLTDLLHDASEATDRALAARQLGELSARTRWAAPDDPAAPAGLALAEAALTDAQDRDPAPRVRAAAAAARLELQPVARSFATGP